ncbi:uncharacterized protein F4807DRAFT_240046 [Annulohypoxylon truncatum]|uniref:uncharacterized protein n=1 Tax=Annulohypoxylon truncatum TaxID=327061 RepID=UPI002007C0FC|nr:uncharacterized protein F4807DRAFT_240046 [Annulohypoxylon truncatum]KAI1206180.1 hypothetical protein F4807DRAFT_240046 [Annulohypoxylon truncatum]
MYHLKPLRSRWAIRGLMGAFLTLKRRSVEAFDHVPCTMHMYIYSTRQGPSMDAYSFFFSAYQRSCCAVEASTYLLHYLYPGLWHVKIQMSRTRKPRRAQRSVASCVLRKKEARSIH